MTGQLVARSNFAKLGIATEVIHFQHDAFGSQLEAILYDIEKFIGGDYTADKDYPQKKEEPYEGNPNGVDPDTEYLRIKVARSHFGDLISDLVYRRFGIKLQVMFNNDCIGAIMPMILNENHVLLDNYWRGGGVLPKDQVRVIKEAKNKTGWVDLEHAKVGGLFSEYLHKMWFDVVGHFRLHQTTVPGMVAIILHELGHAFTYYEFANRLEETNQVLAHLSDEIRNPTSPSKRIYIFKELAGKFGVKEEEFNDIIEEENEAILGVKLFKKYVAFVKSQLPNRKYTETSSEQLADNFAARFGYGRQLITALDQFYQFDPERNSSVRRMAPYFEIIKHMLLIGAAVVYTIGGLVIIGVAIAFLYVICFIHGGEEDEDMTYDRLKMRYTRIRQQYIERINKIPMSKEDLRHVVDEVHQMDEIIKQCAVYRSLFTRLANFVFSKNRAAKASVELQYLLEELTHNNLFLKSAELKVLS